MRSIEIDLTKPFEKIWAAVLALPPGCDDAVTARRTNKAELKQVIRGLYEAANGRQVETSLGLVAIAPPACEFLKAKPLRASTQIDLLIEAAARLLAGLVPAEVRAALGEDIVDDKNGHEASIRYRPTHRPEISLVLDTG